MGLRGHSNGVSILYFFRVVIQTFGLMVYGLFSNFISIGITGIIIVAFISAGNIALLLIIFGISAPFAFFEMVFRADKEALFNEAQQEVADIAFEIYNTNY